MKTCKYLTIVYALLVFLVSPCSGWTQDSSTEELKLVLEEIQDRVQRKMNTNELESSPLIIAVGGCPGVGKSTFSQLLKAALSKIGIVSVIISHDHYGLSQVERKQFASELDPRRIQWHKLHSTMISIRKCENEIIKPTINQLTKEMGQETLQLANVDCVLFEGSWTLCDFPPMNFLQYADISIYLESSLENIYDWKWQRELKKSLQRTPQSFFNHMMEVLKDFAFHVYPTRKNADYIINIDIFHQYSITDSKAARSRPEPDFTSLRLETLTY
jgi:uridine kinase